MITVFKTGFVALILVSCSALAAEFGNVKCSEVSLKGLYETTVKGEEMRLIFHPIDGDRTFRVVGAKLLPVADPVAEVASPSDDLGCSWKSGWKNRFQTSLGEYCATPSPLLTRYGTPYSIAILNEAKDTCAIYLYNPTLNDFEWNRIVDIHENGDIDLGEDRPYDESIVGTLKKLADLK